MAKPTVAERPPILEEVEAQLEQVENERAGIAEQLGALRTRRLGIENQRRVQERNASGGSSLPLLQQEAHLSFEERGLLKTLDALEGRIAELKPLRFDLLRQRRCEEYHSFKAEAEGCRRRYDEAVGLLCQAMVQVLEHTMAAAGAGRELWLLDESLYSRARLCEQEHKGLGDHYFPAGEVVPGITVRDCVWALGRMLTPKGMTFLPDVTAVARVLGRITGGKR